MPTYRVVTLGCRVNHYESLQVEQLLRDLGYTPAASPEADLVVVNTCSVTSSAAAKSRNLLRRFARRPNHPGNGPATLGIGCWTTSDAKSATEISPNLAILGHRDQIADQIRTLLRTEAPSDPTPRNCQPGTVSLPLLGQRQSTYQRALLKIQDGCDAHCTYCIIPKLRPILWTKPLNDALDEARRMVAAGHRELVLTGVFLGAYDQPTALHRRQDHPGRGLAQLIRALCTEVPGLLRLRLSSLEPGDVSPELIDELARHPQVMPHFHLPLQSGADFILRRMNRQYTTADYLNTVASLRARFDRPAFTTDIIVGFPGEDDAAFAQTLHVAREVGFLHIHAFPYSPREGTAAARWTERAVPQHVITRRMGELDQLAVEQSLAYRQQFLGETVHVLVEHPASSEVPGGHDTSPADTAPAVRYGRTERYFAVHFEAPRDTDLTGAHVPLRIRRATPERTLGELIR